MATYNYFSFVAAPADVIAGIDLNKYTGTLSAPTTSNAPTIPNALETPAIAQPGDVLKFSPGNLFGTDELVTFTTGLDYPLTIESLTNSDWSNTMKNKWFQSWMTKVGLGAFITQPVYTTLFNAWEALNGFEMLSGLSVAYVVQIPSTLEIKIGVNMYLSTFFSDWVISNPGTDASNIFAALTKENIYISNVGKVTYGGSTDFVWTFATPFIFSNYTGGGVTNSSLSNGGGNVFAEISLAGGIFDNDLNSIVEARYIVRKNVQPYDPTNGIASVESVYQAPFCIGDVLTVIDTSTYTTRTNLTNTFNWTWFGNLINVPNIWYLADISNPCNDYKTVPIFDQLFPIRAISECKFENFD